MSQIEPNRMAKNLRFLKLVEQCGNPETVTLWRAPQKIPALQAAIRQNRVLTILHSQAGSKREFGLIGFQKEQTATYLIFPKRLPKIPNDAVVVGIRYDLLKTDDSPAVPAAESPSDQIRPQKLLTSKRQAPAIKTKPTKPILKKFEAIISRVASVETKLTVMAASIVEAEAKLLDTIDQTPFKPETIKAAVKSIVQL